MLKEHPTQRTRSVNANRSESDHPEPEKLTDAESQRLGELWEFAYPRLYGYAFKRLRNHSDAEETMQDLAVRISLPREFRRFEQLNATKQIHFIAYCMLRLRGRIKDLGTVRSNRQAKRTIFEEAHPANGQEPADMAADREIRRAVRHAFLSLPKEQRRVLLIIYTTAESLRVTANRYGHHSRWLTRNRDNAFQSLREKLAHLDEPVSQSTMLDRVLCLRDQGVTLSGISKRLRIDRATVRNLIKQQSLQESDSGEVRVALYVVTDSKGEVCCAETSYRNAKCFQGRGDYSIRRVEVPLTEF